MNNDDIINKTVVTSAEPSMGSQDSAPRPSQPVNNTNYDNIIAHKNIIIVCVVAVFVAIICLVVFLAVKTFSPSIQGSISSHFHAEESYGETYYVIDSDYTGEYDVQTGYLEPEESDQSAHNWEFMKQQIDDFDTQDWFTIR